MSSARDRLEPSRLSDQLEALGSDVDLTDLTLALKSRDPLPVIEMITDGQIERTIEGASTLTLTLRDRDQKIRRSALLVAKTSVKIDGLWFRLVSVEAQGNDIRLAFEDREVAVLRSWPPRDRRELWPRMNTPESLGPPGVARARFAERLIKDVKGELAIRFVCPVLDQAPPIRTSRDRKTAAQKRQKRGPGLPADAKITVKGAPASPEQVINTDRVLDVGYSMRVDSILLVAAVMVINQESEAGRRQLGYEGSCSNNGRAIGIFQQCPGGGRPDGGGSWPATYDVEAEAHAFFEVAQWIQDKALKGEYGDSPGPISIDAANVASFCSEIQRNSTWGTSRQGEPYAQSLNEAFKTVALYVGKDEGDIDEPGTDLPPRKAPKAPLILDDGTDDTARMFYRGKRTTRSGRKVWQREDNWDCLGRLAEEIRWRRFCVSGTVYFISEPDLFQAAAAMPPLVPYSPGVDAIDGRYDVAPNTAAVTVKCRADRWAAPPGTVVELKETGLFDGRWIVAAISRSVFNAATTITLKKPRPALPEAKAPEYGAGETSGTIRPKRRSGDPPPQPPPAGKSVRVAAFPVGYAWGSGVIISTVAGHHARALGNWESDDAIDWKGAAGTPIVAVEDGVVSKISLVHVGEHSGNIFGAQLHLVGDSGVQWFYTHFEKLPTSLVPPFATGIIFPGKRVTAGSLLGYVTRWASAPDSSHLHLGSTDVDALEALTYAEQIALT